MLVTEAAILSNMVAAGNMTLELRIGNGVVQINAVSVPMLNGWIARVNQWGTPLPLAGLDSEVYPTADLAVSMGVQALVRHLTA